jgi:hypothetical protein
VRIGLDPDQHRRVTNHQRRHVGVAVQRNHNRHLVADHLAHRREQVAFAIVDSVGRRGAVALQEYSIDASRFAQRLQEGLLGPPAEQMYRQVLEIRRKALTYELKSRDGGTPRVSSSLIAPVMIRLSQVWKSLAGVSEHQSSLR